MQKTNYWKQEVEYAEKSSARAYLVTPKKILSGKNVVYATGCSSCGVNPSSCDSCGGGASECS